MNGYGKLVGNNKKRKKKNIAPNKNNPNKWRKHDEAYNHRPESLSEFDTVDKINPQTGKPYSHPVVYDASNHMDFNDRIYLNNGTFIKASAEETTVNITLLQNLYNSIC